MTKNCHDRAFSLVELLIVLAIVGTMLFFAFPDIVQFRSDSERELAKARADTLNLAAATYFQAAGPSVAAGQWSGKNSEERYGLIKPYIAFPAATLSNFLPSTDYTVTFDDSNPHKVKATLQGPGGTAIAY